MLTFAVLTSFSGCAKPPGDLERINREQAVTIKSMNQEISRLNAELAEVLHDRQDLSKAKSELESRMGPELESGDLSVSMQDRGLVVTVLDRVLFDSGKAGLRNEARATLDKLGEVLSAELNGHMIYIEGHTDNVPIKLSGWRSNWELSTARAMEVVHYLIEARGLDPRRIAATGYGEFHPVTGNDTEPGRLKNRRVEIVISPKKV